MRTSLSPRTITIAGAGFSGTCVLANLIADLTPDSPPTTICIADPRGIFGPGLPYDPDCDALILNQPAYAMSPFASDPGHFVRWLQREAPDQSQRDLENSFQPRGVYGRYLRDVFEAAVASTAQALVEVIRIPAAVTEVSVQDDHSLILNAGELTIHSDALIVADGHYRNELYAPWRTVPGFFEAPCSLSDIKAHLNDTDGVLIIGTGQDSLDHLARLDALGYIGPITAISRRGVQPWLFEPELYHPERQAAPYHLSRFTPETITATQAQTLQQLKSLWDDELLHAQATGYGPGHALGAYFRTEGYTETPGWAAMKEYLRAFYGNPTSPQRVELLKRKTSSGQLQFVEGSVTAEDITQTDTGFAVHGKTYSAIFNGAGCARSARSPDGTIYSPLVRVLDQKNLAAWSETSPLHLKAGRQLGAAFIYYAGPGSHPDKWGVESFRESHAAIASRCLNDLSHPVSQSLPLTNPKGDYHHV